MRGNPAVSNLYLCLFRSIPACAGEPYLTPCLRWCLPVYPRVCGGTELCPICLCTQNGLSPRVRGNRLNRRSRQAKIGSIPACAGEPGTDGTGFRHRGVYPRVCGGTVPAGWGGVGSFGLSPRVRGNPGRRNAPFQPIRSIPACAGEPAVEPSLPAGPGVYPRVCGGTSSVSSGTPIIPGLSPRVRGNHRWPGSRQDAPRSYPRVCGGTLRAMMLDIGRMGLSPRVRGNPKQPTGDRIGYRSIPACAGEPRPTRLQSEPDEVYPRVCGGT